MNAIESIKKQLSIVKDPEKIKALKKKLKILEKNKTVTK